MRNALRSGGAERRYGECFLRLMPVSWRDVERFMNAEDITAWVASTNEEMNTHRQDIGL